MNHAERINSFFTIARPHETQLQRLLSSAEANGVTLRFEFDNLECSVYLNDIKFGVGIGTSKREAKRLAVSSTMGILKRNFPEIEVLHPLSVVQHIEPTSAPHAEFVKEALDKLDEDPMLDVLLFGYGYTDEEAYCIREQAFKRGFRAVTDNDLLGKYVQVSRRHRDFFKIYMHLKSIGGSNEKYKINE